MFSAMVCPVGRDVIAHGHAIECHPPYAPPLVSMSLIVTTSLSPVRMTIPPNSPKWLAVEFVAAVVWPVKPAVKRVNARQ